LVQSDGSSSAILCLTPNLLQWDCVGA
jgi:hypothetical protein